MVMPTKMHNKHTLKIAFIIYINIPIFYTILYTKLHWQRTHTQTHHIQACSQKIYVQTLSHMVKSNKIKETNVYPAKRKDPPRPARRPQRPPKGGSEEAQRDFAPRSGGGLGAGHSASRNCSPMQPGQRPHFKKAPFQKEVLKID